MGTARNTEVQFKQLTSLGGAGIGPNLITLNRWVQILRKLQVLYVKEEHWEVGPKNDSVVIWFWKCRHAIVFAHKQSSRKERKKLCASCVIHL